MREEIGLEELQLKAILYKMLSLLYYQPAEDLAIVLGELTGALESICPELAVYSQEMAGEFGQTFHDLTPLKVDHARLFVGPFALLAAPYSTVYLDGRREVMGESTLAAIEQYREAGLVMSENFKDAPDHIAVELEFMYFLLLRYLETGDIRFWQKQQYFLSAHLGRWACEFAAVLLARAASRFYKNLAIITGEFIRRELQDLSGT